MSIADQTKKSKEPYSRKRPFAGKLLEIRTLNKPQSTKENLHVVLDIEGSDIDYKVGSSFGIYPENCLSEVNELLLFLGVSGNHIVYDKRGQCTLTFEAFLRKKANLQGVTSSQLRLFAEHNPNDKLTEILSNKENLLNYTKNCDLLILVKDFWKSGMDVQLLCDVCCPLLPRYYSIASSQRVVGNKIELMVASFKYEKAGKPRKSITASYIQERCKVNETKISLFLMENKKFCMPEDRNTPVIMIGPGTGFAALRGFLQERHAQNPTLGNNWLFTGDRNRDTDFHYEKELLDYEESSFLKLNTAFSRDHKEKWYVQDEMKLHAKLLWQWIQNGAHIYICGDAKHMAKDVTQTLHNIAVSEGLFSEDDAKTFFRSLKKENRFCQDIY